METDDLIQKTIRSEFKDCTVITIAHRLNTILDSDFIAVLSDGTVVEYDKPSTLLNRKDSALRSMAEDANIQLNVLEQNITTIYDYFRPKPFILQLLPQKQRASRMLYHQQDFLFITENLVNLSKKHDERSEYKTALAADEMNRNDLIYDVNEQFVDSCLQPLV